MKSIQVAVIGYGFAGRSFHSYLVGLEPRMCLRGVASRDPETRERIRAERTCRAYEGFEEVLEDDGVDLVVLATPHDTHCDLTVRALEAGKHVVTDKVMCLDLDECERMIATAERNQRFLSVFHNRRWDGDFLTLQKVLNEGDAGDVRWLEMAWQTFGAPRRWRGSAAAGGGRFYDLGTHLLDQLLLLFRSPVESVFCRMHHDFTASDTESHALTVLRFADGRTGVIDTSSMAARPKPRYLALGSEATFLKYGVDPQEEAMKRGSIDAAVERPETFGRLCFPGREVIVPTIPGRWRNYYKNVAAVLLDDETPAVNLEEMRRLMAVIDAARESARTGATVTPHQ